MADEEGPPQLQPQEEEEEIKRILSSYIVISFSVFLALLPNHLRSQLRDLTEKLYDAEEELREMKYRRQEDSKANARVVEIFASHRNTWQAEEKRLVMQAEAAEEEVGRLRERVAELMEKKKKEQGFGGWRSSRDCYGVDKKTTAAEEEEEEEEEDVVYQHEEENHHQQNNDNDNNNNGFDSEFMASSNLWPLLKPPSLSQDVQYESPESVYNTKHFVARRESPWKVDGDVPSKLKLLEQELVNMEKISNCDLSKKVHSEQAHASADISFLFEQGSEPCEPSLSSEFRTQTQTEFLLEAFRLQQGASETGQKLMALQTEIGKSHYKDEVRSESAPTSKRSLDSVKNTFKEIQRNLEIWLARIIGDLEGILARDGATRAREYYISRYPFVQ
ncbi:hypothetical protein RIF29_36591 [Crotalaria pallida]|uniref:Uncharacterized protein n=1 Tax=Crotalaria pallida TaxID=3830 RepID=A0AAN9EDR3_CROPI